MKAGGGKNKGSAFERETGLKLSLWITNGERSDLFARTVLSGGQFTRSTKRGLAEGVAGDLMANHPRAVDFINLFSIECKHHQDLRIEQFLFQPMRKSTLAGIYDHTKKQAAHNHLLPMVIAKQNRNQPLVMMPGELVGALLDARHKVGVFRMHLLHNNSIIVCPFDSMVDCIDPIKFIVGVVELPANTIKE